jgi:hypothetical protein
MRTDHEPGCCRAQKFTNSVSHGPTSPHGRRTPHIMRGLDQFPDSASVGLVDYSEVGMLGVWYTSVNFGAKVPGLAKLV